jgi:hypothetical protein
VVELNPIGIRPVRLWGDQNLRGRCYILTNRASVLPAAARLIPGLPITQRLGCSFPKQCIVASRRPVYTSCYGTSGGSQSWSYRLYRLPGTRGGVEQLPHSALSPESIDPQRATVGQNNYALPGSVSLESRRLSLRLRDVIPVINSRHSSKSSADPSFLASLQAR